MYEELTKTSGAKKELLQEAGDLRGLFYSKGSTCSTQSAAEYDIALLVDFETTDKSTINRSERSSVCTGDVIYDVSRAYRDTY